MDLKGVCASKIYVLMQKLLNHSFSIRELLYRVESLQHIFLHRKHSNWFFHLFRHENIWRWIWKVHMHPKLLMFMYKLLNHSLTRKKLLYRRNIGNSPTFLCCGTGVESLQHIFLQSQWKHAVLLASPFFIRSHIVRDDCSFR